MHTKMKLGGINDKHLCKVPVCTLSPNFSSDIVTDFPFSRFTVALEGKQPHPEQ